MNMVSLPHSLYSADLESLDFRLFPEDELLAQSSPFFHVVVEIEVIDDFRLFYENDF